MTKNLFSLEISTNKRHMAAKRLSPAQPVIYETPPAHTWSRAANTIPNLFYLRNTGMSSAKNRPKGFFKVVGDGFPVPCAKRSNFRSLRAGSQTGVAIRTPGAAAPSATGAITFPRGEGGFSFLPRVRAKRKRRKRNAGGMLSVCTEFRLRNVVAFQQV